MDLRNRKCSVCLHTSCYLPGLGPLLLSNLGGNMYGMNVDAQASVQLMLLVRPLVLELGLHCSCSVERSGNMNPGKHQGGGYTTLTLLATIQVVRYI